MKTLQNPLYCSYLLKKIAWFSKKSNATIIAGMVLLIFNTMSGFAAITKPTITSFSPTSAKPGDAVTLTGSGFNITAASNIVFFGATRAIVTNATATSVTVTVPTGATYAPISLLNTGTVLSGSSLSNFNPVYAPAKTNITSRDFSPKVDFTTGDEAYSVAIGDLDGDGKPDLAVANSNSATVSVFRNTSASGSIDLGSFAAKVDFTTGTGPRSVAIGDLDGDGKPDLAVANTSSNTASVLRNTSTSGSIAAGSFAAKVNFTTGTGPYSVAIGDLDGDGKPDMAVANFALATVSVFRNMDCLSPTAGGTIAAAQSGASSFDPDAFTSSSAASGDYYGGTLEYKWQSSTTSSTAGFSDIVSSNSDVYDPGSLTQTTWFKRLARVDCKSDWTEAVESNVLTVTVGCTPTTPQPAIVNCWDNFVFNTTTCVWDNTGTQPATPSKVNCWDNFVFNTSTCVWDNTGVQPATPTKVNCWDNFVFNTSTCVWDNTGIQPATPWYKDNDGDGYGDPNSSTLDCDQPEGYVSNSRDCNDSNDKIGIKYWYKDKDGDGHGSRRDEDRRESCSKPQNYGILSVAGDYVENADDCDDDDASIGNTIWYKDADADGYGTGDTLMVCDQPAGYRLLSAMTAATGDCDDTNANIRPNSSTAATSATSSVINPALGTSLKLRKVGGLLGANDTWKWYTSSCGGTLVGTGDSITVAPTVTTTYYVRAEGCTNTNCVSVTVTICGPTGVTSNVANNTICQGISAQLNVQGSLVGSAKWVWYKNGCGYNESSRSSESSIGTGSSLKVTPSSTTTYFVRSEGGACGKTICKSITITVNPKPAKPSSISVPSKVCKQATITLVVGDVVNATSYKWTVPTGWSIVSGQGTKSVKVKAGNSAADIKVAAVNACGTSDSYTKRISPSSCDDDKSLATSSVGKKIVGDQLENTGLLVEAEPHETTFSIFPNPAVNEATVSINYPVTGEGVLQLTDALGKKISNTKISLMPGQNYYGINTTGLDQGLYIVRFIGEKGSRTVRFVVAR